MKAHVHLEAFAGVAIVHWKIVCGKVILNEKGKAGVVGEQACGEQLGSVEQLGTPCETRGLIPTENPKKESVLYTTLSLQIPVRWVSPHSTRVKERMTFLRERYHGAIHAANGTP